MTRKHNYDVLVKVPFSLVVYENDKKFYSLLKILGCYQVTEMGVEQYIIYNNCETIHSELNKHT